MSGAPSCKSRSESGEFWRVSDSPSYQKTISDSPAPLYWKLLQLESKCLIFFLSVLLRKRRENTELLLEQKSLITIYSLGSQKLPWMGPISSEKCKKNILLDFGLGDWKECEMLPIWRKKKRKKIIFCMWFKINFIIVYILPILN